MIELIGILNLMWMCLIKKRKLLRHILIDHDKTIQILSTIIIEMIRAGDSGGNDGDSGGTPDLKLEPRKNVEEYIKPEQLLHEYQ